MYMGIVYFSGYSNGNVTGNLGGPEHTQTFDFKVLNPLTPESAIWHKKSLRAQYWVIWTPNRSWRDLRNGSIKSYSPPT